MSTLPFNYTRRSMRSLYELFSQHDLIRAAGIRCEYGKQAEDRQLGGPAVRWEPGDHDSYELGGEGHAVDTALPFRPGEPSILVTAKAIYTRAASADLWLYSTGATPIEFLIDVVISTLADNLICAGNFQLLGGRNEPQDGPSDAGDVYVLSITVNLPVLKLQRRTQATATNLTTEANL